MCNECVTIVWFGFLRLCHYVSIADSVYYNMFFIADMLHNDLDTQPRHIAVPEGRLATVIRGQTGKAVYSARQRYRTAPGDLG